MHSLSSQAALHHNHDQHHDEHNDDDDHDDLDDEDSRPGKIGQGINIVGYVTIFA